MRLGDRLLLPGRTVLLRQQRGAPVLGRTGGPAGVVGEEERQEPRTSRSSGRRPCSIRARSSARPARSSLVTVGPAGAVWPVVKRRWMVVRTESRRSGSSAGVGIRKGTRAATSFFLARVTRAAMVGSETRNARAMSGVGTPQTRRRVRAIWAAGARAGWQQRKTSRRRSSGAGAGSRADSGSGPLSGRGSGSISRCSFDRRVLARRSASRALCLAAVVSQAPGLSGTPPRAQSTRAAAYASWTHSSARSRSRATRTVAASTAAHSRRCASSTARRTDASLPDVT